MTEQQRSESNLTTMVPSLRSSYADIAFGRQSPCPPHEGEEDETQEVQEQMTPLTQAHVQPFVPHQLSETTSPLFLEKEEKVMEIPQTREFTPQQRRLPRPMEKKSSFTKSLETGRPASASPGRTRQNPPRQHRLLKECGKTESLDTQSEVQARPRSALNYLEGGGRSESPIMGDKCPSYAQVFFARTPSDPDSDHEDFEELPMDETVIRTDTQQWADFIPPPIKNTEEDPEKHILYRHPTIPGLILKKETTPTPPSRNRKHKSANLANKSKTIEPELPEFELPVKVETTKTEFPEKVVQEQRPQAPKRVKRKSKLDSPLPNLPQCEPKDAVKKIEIEKKVEQVPEIKVVSLAEAKVEVKVSPDNETDVNAEQMAVLKKKKKTKKPNAEDELEKALREIKLEEEDKKRKNIKGDEILKVEEDSSVSESSKSKPKKKVKPLSTEKAVPTIDKKTTEIAKPSVPKDLKEELNTSKNSLKNKKKKDEKVQNIEKKAEVSYPTEEIKKPEKVSQLESPIKNAKKEKKIKQPPEQKEAPVIIDKHVEVLTTVPEAIVDKHAEIVTDLEESSLSEASKSKKKKKAKKPKEEDELEKALKEIEREDKRQKKSRKHTEDFSVKEEKISEVVAAPPTTPPTTPLDNLSAAKESNNKAAVQQNKVSVTLNTDKILETISTPEKSLETTLQKTSATEKALIKSEEKFPSSKTTEKPRTISLKGDDDWMSLLDDDSTPMDWGDDDEPKVLKSENPEEKLSTFVPAPTLPPSPTKRKGKRTEREKSVSEQPTLEKPVSEKSAPISTEKVISPPTVTEKTRAISLKGGDDWMSLLDDDSTTPMDWGDYEEKDKAVQTQVEIKAELKPSIPAAIVKSETKPIKHQTPPTPKKRKGKRTNSEKSNADDQIPEKESLAPSTETKSPEPAKEKLKTVPTSEKEAVEEKISVKSSQVTFPEKVILTPTDATAEKPRTISLKGGDDWMSLMDDDSTPIDWGDDEDKITPKVEVKAEIKSEKKNEKKCPAPTKEKVASPSTPKRKGMRTNSNSEKSTEKKPPTDSAKEKVVSVPASEKVEPEPSTEKIQTPVKSLPAPAQDCQDKVDPLTTPVKEELSVAASEIFSQQTTASEKPRTISLQGGDDWMSLLDDDTPMDWGDEEDDKPEPKMEAKAEIKSAPKVKAEQVKTENKSSPVPLSPIKRKGKRTNSEKSSEKSPPTQSIPIPSKTPEKLSLNTSSEKITFTPTPPEKMPLESAIVASLKKIIPEPTLTTPEKPTKLTKSHQGGDDWMSLLDDDASTPMDWGDEDDKPKMKVKAETKPAPPVAIANPETKPVKQAPPTPNKRKGKGTNSEKGSEKLPPSPIKNKVLTDPKKETAVIPILDNKVPVTPEKPQTIEKAGANEKVSEEKTSEKPRTISLQGSDDWMNLLEDNNIPIDWSDEEDVIGTNPKVSAKTEVPNPASLTVKEEIKSNPVQVPSQVAPPSESPKKEAAISTKGKRKSKKSESEEVVAPTSQPSSDTKSLTKKTPKEALPKNIEKKLNKKRPNKRSESDKEPVSAPSTEKTKAESVVLEKEIIAPKQDEKEVKVKEIVRENSLEKSKEKILVEEEKSSPIKEDDQKPSSDPLVLKEERQDSIITVEHVPEVSQYLLDTYANLERPPQKKEVSPLFSPERMAQSTKKSKNLPEEYELFREPESSSKSTKNKKSKEKSEIATLSDDKLSKVESSKPPEITAIAEVTSSPETIKGPSPKEISAKKGKRKSKKSESEDPPQAPVQKKESPKETKPLEKPKEDKSIEEKDKGKGKKGEGKKTQENSPLTVAPPTEAPQSSLGEKAATPIEIKNKELELLIGLEDVDLSTVGPSDEFVAGQQLISLQIKQQEKMEEQSKNKGKGKGLIKKVSSEDSSEEKRVRFVDTPQVLKFGQEGTKPLIPLPGGTSTCADGDVDTTSDDNSLSVSSASTTKHKKKKKRSPRSPNTGLAQSPLMMEDSLPPRSRSPLPPFERQGEEDEFTVVKGKKKNKSKKENDDDDEMPALEAILPSSIEVQKENILETLPPLVPPPPLESEADGRSESSINSNESWTHILEEEEPKLTLLSQDMENLIKLEIEQFTNTKPKIGDFSFSFTSDSTVVCAQETSPENRFLKEEKLEMGEPQAHTGLTTILSIMNVAEEVSASPLLEFRRAETAYQEYLSKNNSDKNQPLSLAQAAKEVTQQVEQLTNSITNAVLQPSTKKSNKESVSLVKKNIDNKPKPFPLPEEKKKKVETPSEMNDLESSLLHLMFLYNDYERVWREGTERNKKSPPKDNKKEEKVDKKDGKGGGGGSPNATKKKPDQPPPKDGGSGGGRKAPVTELLNTELSGKNWMDWSTRLSSEPPSPAVDDNFQKIKDSAKEDVQVLGAAVNAGIETLQALSSANLQDKVERTWELVGGLKDLDGAATSLKDIFKSLPQDDFTVQSLGTELKTICSKLKEVSQEAERLNKEAKLELGVWTGMECGESEQPPVPRDVTDKEDDVGGEVKVHGKIIASITTTMDPSETPRQNVEIEELKDDHPYGQDASILRTVEDTTFVIPPEGTTTFMTTGPDGNNYLTNMQRTVVVNQRRETTQSLHVSSSTTSGFGDEMTCSSSSDAIWLGGERSVTPELVEEVPNFSLPAGVSPATADWLHSPTRSTQPPITSEEGEGLTVRVRQITKHVTRRVIRKRRRIIRKVAIINGKEVITEEVIDEPDEVDEQTAEMTSGPIVDFSSDGLPSPSSLGVIITEIDSYTPTHTPDIPEIPDEVEEVVRATLETSVGPILSKVRVQELIKQRRNEENPSTSIPINVPRSNQDIKTIRNETESVDRSAPIKTDESVKIKNEIEETPTGEELVQKKESLTAKQTMQPQSSPNTAQDLQVHETQSPRDEIVQSANIDDKQTINVEQNTTLMNKSQQIISLKSPIDFLKEEKDKHSGEKSVPETGTFFDSEEYPIATRTRQTTTFPSSETLSSWPKEASTLTISQISQKDTTPKQEQVGSLKDSTEHSVPPVFGSQKEITSTMVETCITEVPSPESLNETKQVPDSPKKSSSPRKQQKPEHIISDSPKDETILSPDSLEEKVLKLETPDYHPQESALSTPELISDSKNKIALPSEPIYETATQELVSDSLKSSVQDTLDKETKISETPTRSDSLGEPTSFWKVDSLSQKGQILDSPIEIVATIDSEIPTSTSVSDTVKGISSKPFDSKNETQTRTSETPVGDLESTTPSISGSTPDSLKETPPSLIDSVMETRTELISEKVLSDPIGQQDAIKENSTILVSEFLDSPYKCSSQPAKVSKENETSLTPSISQDYSQDVESLIKSEISTGTQFPDSLTTPITEEKQLDHSLKQVAFKQQTSTEEPTVPDRQTVPDLLKENIVPKESSEKVELPILPESQSKQEVKEESHSIEFGKSEDTVDTTQSISEESKSRTELANPVLQSLESGKEISEKVIPDDEVVDVALRVDVSTEERKSRSPTPTPKPRKDKKPVQKEKTESESVDKQKSSEAEQVETPLKAETGPDHSKFQTPVIEPTYEPPAVLKPEVILSIPACEQALIKLKTLQEQAETLEKLELSDLGLSQLLGHADAAKDIPKLAQECREELQRLEGALGREEIVEITEEIVLITEKITEIVKTGRAKLLKLHEHSITIPLEQRVEECVALEHQLHEALLPFHSFHNMVAEHPVIPDNLRCQVMSTMQPLMRSNKHLLSVKQKLEEDIAQKNFLVQELRPVTGEVESQHQTSQLPDSTNLAPVVKEIMQTSVVKESFQIQPTAVQKKKKENKLKEGKQQSEEEREVPKIVSLVSTEGSKQEGDQAIIEDIKQKTETRLPLTTESDATLQKTLPEDDAQKLTLNVSLPEKESQLLELVSQQITKPAIGNDVVVSQTDPDIKQDKLSNEQMTFSPKLIDESVADEKSKLKHIEPSKHVLLQDNVSTEEISKVDFTVVPTSDLIIQTDETPKNLQTIESFSKPTAGEVSKTQPSSEEKFQCNIDTISTNDALLLDDTETKYIDTKKNLDDKSDQTQDTSKHISLESEANSSKQDQILLEECKAQATEAPVQAKKEDGNQDTSSTDDKKYILIASETEIDKESPKVATLDVDSLKPQQKRKTKHSQEDDTPKGKIIDNSGQLEKETASSQMIKATDNSVKEINSTVSDSIEEIIIREHAYLTTEKNAHQLMQEEQSISKVETKSESNESKPLSHQEPISESIPIGKYPDTQMTTHTVTDIRPEESLLDIKAPSSLSEIDVLVQSETKSEKYTVSVPGDSSETAKSPDFSSQEEVKSPITQTVTVQKKRKGKKLKGKQQSEEAQPVDIIDNIVIQEQQQTEPQLPPHTETSEILPKALPKDEIKKSVPIVSSEKVEDFSEPPTDAPQIKQKEEIHQAPLLPESVSEEIIQETTLGPDYLKEQLQTAVKEGSEIVKPTENIPLPEAGFEPNEKEDTVVEKKKKGKKAKKDKRDSISKEKTPPPSHPIDSKIKDIVTSQTEENKVHDTSISVKDIELLDTAEPIPSTSQKKKGKKSKSREQSFNERDKTPPPSQQGFSSQRDIATFEISQTVEEPFIERGSIVQDIKEIVQETLDTAIGSAQIIEESKEIPEHEIESKVYQAEQKPVLGNKEAEPVKILDQPSTQEISISKKLHALDYPAIDSTVETTMVETEKEKSHKKGKKEKKAKQSFTDKEKTPPIAPPSTDTNKKDEQEVNRDKTKFEEAKGLSLKQTIDTIPSTTAYGLEESASNIQMTEKCPAETKIQESSSIVHVKPSSPSQTQENPSVVTSHSSQEIKSPEFVETSIQKSSEETPLKVETKPEEKNKKEKKKQKRNKKEKMDSLDDEEIKYENQAALDANALESKVNKENQVTEDEQKGATGEIPSTQETTIESPQPTMESVSVNKNLEPQIQYVTKIRSPPLSPQPLVSSMVESLESETSAQTLLSSISTVEETPIQIQDEIVTETEHQTDTTTSPSSANDMTRPTVETAIESAPLQTFIQESKDDQEISLPTEEQKTHRIKKTKKGKSKTFKLVDGKPVPVMEILVDKNRLEKECKLQNVIKKLGKMSSTPSSECSQPLTFLALPQKIIPDLVQDTRDGLERLEAGLSAEDSFTITEEILYITEKITEIVETFKVKLFKLQHHSTTPIEHRMHEFVQLQNQMEEAMLPINSFKNMVVEHSAIDEGLKAQILSALEPIVHSFNETLVVGQQLEADLASQENLLHFLSETQESAGAIEMEAQQVINSEKPINDQIAALDSLELKLNEIKPRLLEFMDKGEKFPQVGKEVGKLEQEIIRTEILILEERERLLQITSIDDEYKHTLQEFSQVIQVAESLVDPKVNVKDLPQLQEELLKNRKFFGNLKRCQHALEKLEYALDDSTKEMHKVLHHKLYDEASSILERAAKKRQQMAMAAARWARLEQGLEEEENWLKAVSKKIPSLDNVSSAECERYCHIYQAMYSDIIVHQARLMQLRTVSESLRENINCPQLEGLSDPHVEQLLRISGKITLGLQALIAFRDSFSGYERIMQRLRSWLQKAEAKMDALALQPASHPYDFWELKAQLESQQPLKSEAAVLLNQASKALQVTDEQQIREVFANFDDRWSSLMSAVAQTELSSFQEEPESSTVSVSFRLKGMGRELEDMQEIISSMLVQVESEDDLYLYLERLQILKAQILNKRHQLSNMLSKEGALEPEDAERIGLMLSIITRLDSQVSVELDVAHTVREKFATFGRMSLKTRRLQDTLRARVDQWTSFFELSQDILRQALQNCQNLDQDISNNHVDLDKMRLVLNNFPSTPHLALNTGKMDHELHEMEATVHTLSARIQDLRKLVQEQLGFWQQYEHVFTSLSRLIAQIQTTLDTVTQEAPNSLHALMLTQRHLQNAQELVKLYKSQELERVVEEVKKDSPPDVQEQIDKRVQGILEEWGAVKKQLDKASVSFATAEPLWKEIEDKKSALSAWLREVQPQLHSRHTPTPEAVDKFKQELKDQEAKMNELRTLASELCLTLSLDSGGADKQLPLTLELEGLSRKLHILKTYLSSLNIIIQDTPTKQLLLEETRQTLDSAAEELVVGSKPTVKRVNAVQKQLFKLGNAEGRMMALESEAVSAGGPQDVQLTDLLKTSQKVFHQTFEEYLKLWRAVPERAETEEVLQLWQNSLIQCRDYLKEPMPFTIEQLIEDSSLCAVHANILQGQSDSLVVLVNKRPADFQSVETLYTEIETELCARQDTVTIRLETWREYKTAKEAFSHYMQYMEKEKRTLELPFLQLKRLPITQSQIQKLIDQLKHGEELLLEVKKHHSDLLPHCPSDMNTQLNQELVSYVSRFANLQASLRTWHDNITRLHDTSKQCEDKMSRISTSLSSIREEMTDEKPPTSFAELKKLIKTLNRLYKDTNELALPLEELDVFLEEVKSSIQPSDSRLLQQRHWSLAQQQVELLSDLNQSKSEAQQKLDLLPHFDTKCKNWLLWAKDIKESLMRPNFQNLEDYLHYLEQDAAQEIEIKTPNYEWLHTSGTRLSEMTSGKEKKELVHTLKEVSEMWKKIRESNHQQIARVNRLLELISDVDTRSKAAIKTLKNSEKYITEPLAIDILSKDQISKTIEHHEKEQRTLNNEIVEINAILNLCEVGATDCEDLRMSEAQSLRKKAEDIDYRWKQLISGYSTKKTSLVALRERFMDLEEKCEVLELLLAQVADTLGSINPTNACSIGELQANSAQVTELIESLQAMSPKVEDLNNDYCFLVKQINASDPGPLSGRVKNVLKNWKAHLNNCHILLELLQKSSLQSNFEAAYSETNTFYQNLCKQVEELQSSSESPQVIREELSHIRSYLSQGQELLEDLAQQGKNWSQVDSASKQTIKDRRGNLKALKSYLDNLLSDAERHVQHEEEEYDEEEIDSSVQVDTLHGEHDASVQVETLGLEPNFYESIPDISVSPAPEGDSFTSATLTREDIYLQELEKVLIVCQTNIEELSEAVEKKATHETLVKLLAITQSQTDHLTHLHKLLVEEQGVSLEDASSDKVTNIKEQLKDLEETVRGVGQNVRELSPSKREVTCPACTPTQRGAWDSTLWRLEQWLTHAEGKLKTSMKKRPPTDVEQLEDAILCHRELVLDLDSHRTLVKSLSGVLSHLNEHGETSTMGSLELEKLRERLRIALDLWKKVCHNTALWQARLQIALIENSGFHANVEHYENLIDSIQENIQKLEPVDLSQSRATVIAKWRKFASMRDQLIRTEPEVGTLLATAEQLFVNPTAIEKEGILLPGPSDKDVFVGEKSANILERISTLNLQLKALQKVCDAYVRHLSVFIRDNPESRGESPLLSLSEEILERSGRSSPALARSSLHSTTSENEEEGGHSVIMRGGRYVARVVRASLPIQALILLLLGAATLIPYGEEDYLCVLRNNFQHSLEPMLHYPDGPPPI